MTTLLPTESSNGWRARQHLEILRDQLAAIDAWNAARASAGIAEDARETAARSREARLDVSRRMDVLRREHEALVARTDQHLANSAKLLSAQPAPRAIIAHRNDWFRAKVGEGLLAHGIEVVAQLDNGADAVGVSVAEQPDLLLVEDKLAMINGDQVIRQVLMFAPATISVAQVSYDDEVGRLLDAGARTAYTRRVPPLEVAEQMALMVRA